MYGDIIDLLEFIKKSPSPWHTASAASEQLLNAGFQELDWTEGWELQRYGRYFTKVYGSSIFAFTLGNGDLTAKNSLKLAAAHTDFPGFRIKPEAGVIKDGYGLLGRDPLEVFLAGRDDQSCHIECTRRDKHLLLAFGTIAGRTMVLAKEHHGEVVFLFAPAHDIHHRLGIGLRQSAIDGAEELFVVLAAAALDEQCRSRVFGDVPDAFVLVEQIHLLEVTAQSLPLLLQGEHSARSSLEMHVVGGAGATLRTIVEDH